MKNGANATSAQEPVSQEGMVKTTAEARLAQDSIVATVLAEYLEAPTVTALPNEASLPLTIIPPTHEPILTPSLTPIYPSGFPIPTITPTFTPTPTSIRTATAEPLAITVFPTQGYTAPCPDGSEPAKSLSVDGTYFVYKCAADRNNTNEIKESEANLIEAIWGLDENSNLNDYSYIQDPTGKFDLVHKFTTGTECGSIERSMDGDYVGEMESSDCGENNVRSQLYQDVWEGPSLTQPNHASYEWNVYLSSDFPNQGKLLLGEFHNGECPHISFTNRDGEDYLMFETMKLWGGDCVDTVRLPLINMEDLLGKWTNFRMEVIWETSNSGIAMMWIDDELVLDFKGRTLTKQKENLNFMIIGNYFHGNDTSKAILPSMSLWTTPKIYYVY